MHSAMFNAWINQDWRRMIAGESVAKGYVESMLKASLRNPIRGYEVAWSYKGATWYRLYEADAARGAI